MYSCSVRRIPIEEYPPLADAQTEQAVPVSQLLNVALAMFPVASKRDEDPHCGVPVDPAQISARSRVPRRNSKSEFLEDFLMRDTG
jgi:hypothetical protein